MAQTQIKPYNTTKALAVIFTVISLLGACSMAVSLITDGDTDPAVVLFSWAVFEAILVLVIIYEWPVLLVVSLVVLAIGNILFTLSIKVSLKGIAEEFQADKSLNINSKEEANAAAAIVWFIFLIIFIFQMIRYYFVTQVYRYGKKNCALEAMQSQPPVYSVRPAELP